MTEEEIFQKLANPRRDEDGRLYVSLRRAYLPKPTLTVAFARALAEQCPQLQSLNLDGAQLTDAGVTVLAQHCPQLEYLHLAHTAVTDEGVSEVAKHCPLLQSLNLSDTSVTDAGITAVGENCPELRFLCLSNTRVTDAGAADFKRRRPSVRLNHSHRRHRSVDLVGSGKSLSIQIESPGDASDEDILAIIKRLVWEADGLHRALGGHGLQIESLEIHEEVFEPAGVE
ncbi:leucine-rich repeat domain-containing protein [Zavarzinella formosa]|uniref:hypothetical protein n=1 Tax=Zavarzinella formosa TaxID=360055 RepID=UPI000496FBBB|nr:hypothetical protein [Zavarzinella formosa]